MELEEYFSVFDKLNVSQQKLLTRSAVKRTVQAGTMLHNGDADCLGLILVKSGQLRAFILSEEGREVTIYRLFDRDICLFSASCMMNSIQFEVSVSAEKDTELWIIPPDVYKQLMSESLAVANYTNEIMASRFSEVMWLIEQIMWKSFDRRLAGFLIEESSLEQADTLKMTHEKIAAHMGTAREVVTRMLRYFQSEGMVKLTRGEIELTDRARLIELSEE